MNEVILDVRETGEFDFEHIENSIHLPLSSLNSRAPGVLRQLSGKNIVLMCQSGYRAKLAHEKLKNLAIEGCNTITVYEGGILKWKKEGGAMIYSKSGRLPVMQQVQVIAGSIVLISVLLALFIDQRFIWVAGFIGAALIFAGISGFCLLARILEKMPWNRN